MAPRLFIAAAPEVQRLPEYLAFLLLFVVSSTSAVSQQNSGLLTTAQQVHRLTPEEAAAARPVRIEGVVTFYYPDIDELFVQDATDGIFIEIGSSSFWVSDFQDCPSFAVKLMRGTSASEVPAYLWTQLTPAEQGQLRDCQARGAGADWLPLAKSLTRLIQRGRSLYDPPCFAGVVLSAKTQALLARHPAGPALARLNRLLLEDAFPEDISRSANPERYGFEISVGQLLEIEGVSAPGGFSPDIILHRMRLLGTSPLPAPVEAVYGDLAGGRQDCRWVKFKGIVHSVGREGFTHLQSLDLVGAGGRVVVPIQHFNPGAADGLIDAEVEVTGVCTTHFNRKGQLMGVAVQVSGMEAIRVLKPAPDPAAIPARKIGSLLMYAPEEDYGHRVKVQGTVTLQIPGRSLFITDEGQGLFIQTASTNLVQPGDRVAAWGFPLPSEYVSPVLQDAEFNQVGTGPPPPVRKVSAEEGFRDVHDATLVEMEAMLMNRALREHDESLELHAGNLVFNAELQKPGIKGDPLAAVPDGSRVRLTGICQVSADPYRREQPPQTFRLLLRSAADVVLVQRPSWWTAKHALWVLTGTLTVFLASLAWVAALRKQVKAQTLVIRQKVQREAALDERSRIARDLHDDLGAGLTHIAFLSQVAQKEEECPGPLKEHLREISSSAQDSFQALDEIVWVVNPRNDTIESLTSYMCQFAEGFFRGTPTRCRLDLPTSLPDDPVPTEMRNNLFLAVKEALNNVRRHARASEVVVRVRFESPVFSLSIEDNGAGFAPDEGRQGNGLVNMKRRLEKLGGTFKLGSRPGAGTRILFSVKTGDSGP